eukprot:COSAG03_NODE_9715_length_698_cov_0.973289_1_plen_58_part_10
MTNANVHYLREAFDPSLREHHHSAPVGKLLSLLLYCLVANVLDGSVARYSTSRFQMIH